MTRIGVYCHYKGTMYRVLFLAVMSASDETDEKNHVVYMSMDDGRVYVTAESRFHELREDPSNHKMVPRFYLVRDLGGGR